LSSQHEDGKRKPAERKKKKKKNLGGGERSVREGVTLDRYEKRKDGRMERNAKTETGKTNQEFPGVSHVTAKSKLRIFTPEEGGGNHGWRNS